MQPVVLHFSHVTKSCKKVKKLPILDHLAFQKINFAFINAFYVSVTKCWTTVDKTQLLLSYVKPHNPMSVDTVSFWLKEFLKLFGIDTTVFSGHSTRAAAASEHRSTEVLAQEFSCEVSKVFKNTYFEKHMRTTASIISYYIWLVKASLRVYYAYFVYHPGALTILAFCKENFVELVDSDIRYYIFL